MREEIKNLSIMSFGIIMVCFGGVSNILQNWLFWFPLGLLTIPWITSVIKVASAQVKR